MKKISFLLLIIISNLSCFAQKYHLTIEGKTVLETKSIDSSNYQTNHQDLNHLFDEITKTQNYLIQKGFLETLLVNTVKTNDSSYVTQLNLGKRTTILQIVSLTNQALNKMLQIKQDTITIGYTQIEAFLNEKKQLLNNQGYPLASVNLTDIKKRGPSLIAQLIINQNQQKKINAIVISNNNNFKFPKGHLNQIEKKYKNNLLSDKTITTIKKEFDKYNFVTQLKYPETLFTNDSTKIYVYLEKQSANTFDGFIGFNTNENQKLTLSGYLDLQLENILNAGEEFSLNWKSNGNNQTTFNSTLEIPYLFNSRIGLKGHINIFKQDSTFQNTRTALELGYLIKYNSRLFIGRETTSSSDIQNTNNGEISDFKSDFFTTSFVYTKRDPFNLMNPIKTNLSLKTGIGNRTNTNAVTTEDKSKQSYLELQYYNTWYLNNKNQFNINAVFQTLDSRSYNTNELFRFGGIKTIRGYQENSLQAKTYFVLATEYRYLLNNNFYLNTVVDYGHYLDPTNTSVTNYNKNLLGIGIGIAALTKTGLIKFLAVKTDKVEQKNNNSNTLIYISYNILF